jgi:signal transduction histidine kinase
MKRLTKMRPGKPGLSLPAISFEKILNDTLRLLRKSCKAQQCLFLLVGDQGDMFVRAADGLPRARWEKAKISPADPPLARCLAENSVVEFGIEEASPAMSPLLKIAPRRHYFVGVPVFGQNRALGAMILGPFSREQSSLPRESELRAAGAVCAVLSAHWRMYEWMSAFLSEVNHELRTPLTAVQGSIGMVLGGLFGQVGGEAKEMLEMAQKGCERTVRAIEDYLTGKKLPER